MLKRVLGIISLVALGVMSVGVHADAKMDEAVANYASIVYATYEDTLTLTQELQTAVQVFVADPTEETLQAAKDAWLAARNPYGQTEVYRFYGGPIDDEDGPEALINAWPMDEAFVDYVEGDPDTGIISNIKDFPELSVVLIADANEQGAEENISTGYHAIEFLLWGQDLNDEGPGQRPVSDYTTDPDAERRGQYLTIVTDLLVNHLEGLVADWKPDFAFNYRATFEALPAEEAITRIVTGLGSLSSAELPGERIYTAYDNMDQEDEHSCFSDNTYNDILNNFQGIKNVFFGSYTRIDGTEITGTGMKDVIEAVDPTLAARMIAQVATIDAAIAAMHTPFDQAVTMPEYREGVLATADSIFDLGDMVSEMAAALNLSIS